MLKLVKPSREYLPAFLTAVDDCSALVFSISAIATVSASVPSVHLISGSYPFSSKLSNSSLR